MLEKQFVFGENGMEIFHTCKKLSCSLNPNSLLQHSLLFISLRSLNLTPNISTTTTQTEPHYLKSFNFNFRPRTLSCSYSCTSSSFRYNEAERVQQQQQQEVAVGLIKRDEINMESELNKLGMHLSLDLLTHIFSHLNTDGVSGLRFFSWIRQNHAPFYRNAHFCSLIIDNLGRLHDYNLMLLMLKEFSKEKLCLTEKAFGFLQLQISSSNDASFITSHVTQVVDMLNDAGGSSRSSGIFALIKVLSTLNCFDLAVFVMELTARKTSYYNVLIWAKCRTRNFEQAYGLYDEMRTFGCDPNANSYNYLLGSLCKNGRTAQASQLVEYMNDFGYLPDAITFEVIICHACRLGRLDSAIEFLNQMMSRGIQPRHTTHAVIIKSYFFRYGFQEAYKFVVDMYDKCKYSGNMNYSLLASLLQTSRKSIEAREVLVDMMDKGLKPNFPVYIKVLKNLHKLDLFLEGFGISCAEVCTGLEQQGFELTVVHILRISLVYFMDSSVIY